MAKRPAYQWYPGDFRRDTGVQTCTFEARALWREMLDLMHDGQPRGCLNAGGAPITPEALSRIIGIPVAKVKRWLDELEQHHVFSRTDEGVIYSRRMVRDEEIATARAAGGSLSLNNPNVPRPRKGAAKPVGKDTSKDTFRPSLGGSSGGSPAVAVAVATAVKGDSTAKKPPASGEAVPRTTGLDVLSKSACDVLFETWTSRRGVIAYGRFRKTVLLLFQAGVTRYTTAEISDAMVAYAEWVEEQPDKEQSFCTLERFVSEIAKWAKLGKMPYTLNGEMTERGQWAGSRELRDEALAKRSA